MKQVNLRKDIQGYRALAIISVMLFHFKGSLPGGFIGVDIFFAISGFVITSLIYRTWENSEKFNLLDFYLRRIRRLLPALSLMISVFCILIFFLFSPLGMQQNASKTAIGSLSLSANYVVQKITSNYFGLPASTNPFLHTWSLSVEEQFYLIYPLLIVCLGFVIKLKKRTRLLGTLTLFVMTLSIFFMNTSTLNGWLSGFYSPVTRAWEFCVGILAFLVSIAAKNWNFPKFLITFLTSASYGGIIFSLIFFSRDYGYPSLFLFLPMISIGFLLAFGAKGKVNKVLSSKAAQYIGDRSYSLYLWHWPFIVLFKYLFPIYEFAEFYAILLSIIFAILSYKYVENPIRIKNKFSSKHYFGLIVIAVLIPITLASSVGYIAKYKYFPKYESGKIQGEFEGDIGAIGFESFVKSNNASCHNREVNPRISICEADIVVLGDSHADHLVPGFITNFPQLTVLDLGNQFFDEFAQEDEKSNLVQLIENKFTKVVVINKYWANTGVPANLRSLVQAIARSGKSVVILDDVPNFPFDAFTCKYGKSVFINSSNCSMPAENFTQQLLSYQSLLESIGSDIPGVTVFKSSDLFCTLRNCSMVRNGLLNYLDLNHLNVNGSLFVTRKLVKTSPVFCNLLADKLGSHCRTTLR